MKTDGQSVGRTTRRRLYRLFFTPCNLPFFFPFFWVFVASDQGLNIARSASPVRTYAYGPHMPMRNSEDGIGIRRRMRSMDSPIKSPPANATPSK